MKKISYAVAVAFLLIAFAQFSLAQDDIKIVPIGQSIRPEGLKKVDTKKPIDTAKSTDTTKPTSTTVKKTRKSWVTLKEGKSFLIESATAMSSGINKVEDTFYFRVAEDVGPNGQNAIRKGVLGQGTVTEIISNKKAGKLVIELNTISLASGKDAKLKGTLEILGDKSHAAIAVGDKFTAALGEKVALGKNYQDPKLPKFKDKAFFEIQSKWARADIKKGRTGGLIELILEPQREASIDDVDLASVALYRFDNTLLPTEVFVRPNKVKKGDKNKNGTPDLSLEISTWDFIKFLPRGTEFVFLKGKLLDGREFDASTRVTIDY